MKINHSLKYLKCEKKQIWIFFFCVHERTASRWGLPLFSAQRSSPELLFSIDGESLDVRSDAAAAALVLHVNPICKCLNCNNTTCWRREDSPISPSCGRTYLHHQHDGVEGDQRHDGVLKRRGHHKLPHLVLEGQLVLWHVSGKRLGIDGKVNASPLSKKQKSKKCMNLIPLLTASLLENQR